MSQSDPVLLVHGAWQGAWAWSHLIPLLEQRGIRVIAADLPGNGVDGSDPATATLKGCLDYLEDLIARYDRVSVVGHSGGGVFASALAERNSKVARLAYVAGIMLPAGRSFAEIQAEVADDDEVAFGIAAHLDWSPDRQVSFVPQAAAEAIFFHDCSAEAARGASVRLTGQGQGARAVQLDSVDRVSELPRFYIEAIEDRSLPIAVQRRMQTLMPGALIANLPTGHVPQLSAPGLLADLLGPFLMGERDHEALLARDGAREISI